MNTIILRSSLLSTKMVATASARRVVGGASTTTRSFSSECAPAQKLRCVFEEYRQAHFSRELPSRFRKEIVKVIQGGDSFVTVDSFNVLLGNIGRHDAYLTETELSDLLLAAGSKSRKIPVEQAMQLMM